MFLWLNILTIQIDFGFCVPSNVDMICRIMSPDKQAEKKKRLDMSALRNCYAICIAMILITYPLTSTTGVSSMGI